MTLVENKWLEGPYAPIAGDVTATELEVEGTLPVELQGRYLRNGPNPITPVDPATHHWFVGDGMVHGIRLGDGKADWYHARMVRSTSVSEALGEEPAPGERHGGFDTANTNVIGIGGRTFALVEAGARPVELTYELDTIEHSDLGGTLPHGYTAHPKVDPATGDLHAMAYHWALPHLEYIGDRPRRAGEARLETIEVPDGPMVHDCSITARWAVVYDLPVTFDLDIAMGQAPASLRVERGPRRPRRPPAARRPGQRGALVRGRSLLRVPPAQRPRRRRQGGARRRPLRPDVRRPPPRARRRRSLLWRWTIDTATGRCRGAALRPAPRVPPRRRAARGPPAPLGLRHRGVPQRPGCRQRLWRPPRPHRRQERQRGAGRPRPGRHGASG